MTWGLFFVAARSFANVSVVYLRLAFVFDVFFLSARESQRFSSPPASGVVARWLNASFLLGHAPLFVMSQTCHGFVLYFSRCCSVTLLCDSDDAIVISGACLVPCCFVLLVAGASGCPGASLAFSYSVGRAVGKVMTHLRFQDTIEAVKRMEPQQPLVCGIYELIHI